jgi:signal transduction histidine kinase
VTRVRAGQSPRDVLVAGVIGALFLIEIWGQAEFARDRTAASALAVVLSIALAFARHLPLVPLGTAVAAIELSNLAAPALANTPTFWLAFAVAGYCCGRYTHGASWPAAVVMVLVAVPFAAIEPGQAFRAADAGYIALLLAAPVVAGRVIRRRHQHESRLARRAETLERERHEMARELHDIVAHGLSVMVLQARGARRVLSTEPDETRRALDSIDSRALVGDGTPASRRWPTCGRCSGSFATATTGRRSRHSRDSSDSASSSPT